MTQTLQDSSIILSSIVHGGPALVIMTIQRLDFNFECVAMSDRVPCENALVNGHRIYIRCEKGGG